jgi:hypothetical protein
MLLVIPAKAGIQKRAPKRWIPACAGMTEWRCAAELAHPRPFSTDPLTEVLCAVFRAFAFSRSKVLL